MSTWFIFSILMMISVATNEIFQKISLAQKIKISAITNNFFIWILQGIFGLILAVILNQTSFIFDNTSLLKLFLVSVVYFLGGTFYYTSFKGNSPSLSIILSSISVIISTTLGFIFFNEPIFLQKIFGLVLILLALFIANYQQKERLSKNNLFALLGGICFGVAFTLDKSFVLKASPMIYVSILSFSIALVSLAVSAKHIIGEAKHFKLKNYLPMFLVSIFGTCFNFFMFMAYNQGGQVGIVDALEKSSVFMIIVIEVFLLKDRSHLLKKIIGSCIAIIGVYLLSNL
jgi:drug/metabolite transporter (DMT)-like permease